MSNLICFFGFFMVKSFWIFHLNEETRWMPRYVYCSCCLRVRKDLFLKWICCACMYALKVMSSKFDLFGHLVIVHLERLWSKCVHFDNM